MTPWQLFNLKLCSQVSHLLFSFEIWYVTRFRKRDLIPQKFKIVLLLPAHCAFYWESNGTKIAGIWAFVAEIWLHLSQQLWNGGFEKNALQFQRSNFPYTIALACAIRLRLLSCDYSPRLSACRCSSLVFGFVWRHGWAFFVVLR